MTAVIAFVQASELSESEVLDLYDSVGWTEYTRDPKSLMQGLAGSHRIVMARDQADQRLVGLARTISDGATIAYLQDILVRPEAQRTGLGRQLFRTIFDTYDGVRQRALMTGISDRQRAFYESLGFAEAHDHDPEMRAFVQLVRSEGGEGHAE